MPKPWTMSRVVERIVEASGITPTEVDGGDVVVTDGTIRHTLRVAKDKHDKGSFGWTVYAEDESTREPLAKFGGVGVEIWRPPRDLPSGASASMHGYRYPWPATGDLDEAVLADVRRHVPQAMGFVRDRHDLGEVLLAGEDVRRGDVWANLREGTAPARLAKAVILARKTGDRALEEAAFDLLRREGERDITWTPGQPYLFRQAVADWARQYAPHVDVDLNDLIRLKRRK